MKNWMGHLNDIAAGLLFDGGYVATTTRRPDPRACAAPVAAGGQATAKADETGRRSPRPSARLVTN